MSLATSDPPVSTLVPSVAAAAEGAWTQDHPTYGRSAMATKALRRATCRYCQCPIGLSHWSGWVELSPYGSHDMCPGTISASHEPSS